MSETNQEELSVEDILSSIKDILVDENGAPIEQPQTTPQIEPEIPTNISQPQTQIEEDVFDLDSSMIVEETSPAEDINQLLASTPSEPEEIKEETPINIADSIDIEQTLDIANKLDINEISNINEILKEEATAPVAPVDDEKSEVEEETIDTSAGIINNFAKLFAEKQQATTSEQPAENNTKTNTQDIANLLKQTIINQVKVSMDSNFDRIAGKIITEQTQQWLNQNLATIVEKIVAKEIERVIAKVGS